MNKTSRRAFLTGTTLLLGGAIFAALRTSGYRAPIRKSALVTLSAWQYAVVSSVAQRIAAPDREGDRSIPSVEEVDVVGFIDSYMAQMPPAMRRDLLRFFAYIEHVAPLRIGLATRFSRLLANDQDRVLASIESANEGLLRGGFEGAKSLVFMGYYRDPRTWKMLRYDGPIVGRPQNGWWQ